MKAEFSIQEILTNAPAIVAYAVRRGWCSRPRPMQPTTQAEYSAARRALGLDDADPEESPAERETEPVHPYVEAYKAVAPAEFTSKDCFDFCIDAGWKTSANGLATVSAKLRQLFFRDEVEEVRRDGASFVWRFADSGGGR